MENQKFDELVSLEIDGAAVWQMIDREKNIVIPIKIDHFRPNQDGHKNVVDVVSEVGAIFRCKTLFPTADLASQWIEKALKNHNILERQIAFRYIQSRSL